MACPMSQLGQTLRTNSALAQPEVRCWSIASKNIAARRMTSCARMRRRPINRAVGKENPAEAGLVFATDILISGGLCVLRHTSKVDQHAALIAGDPGVVTGRHIECITGAELDLGA